MADADKRYFFAKSWPRLLQKLSLDDGMKCFLEWKDQYEDCSHYGINNQVVAQFIGLEARYHVLHLLDRQLLNVLMDCMEEENFRDMDHETFVQELLDIFGGDTVSAVPSGGADYSAQWAEYYRGMGMMREAEAIEAQMRGQS